MFFRKNKHKDYALVVFGLIAFLIILSVVFIIVIFLNKVEDIKEPVKNEIQNYIPKEVASSIVAEKYSKAIEKLRSDVEVTEEVSDSFDLVEEVFFSVRVPDKMLDDHLQTFLQINTLKEKNGSKEEILTLLDELITKINTYYEENSN